MVSQAVTDNAASPTGSKSSCPEVQFHFPTPGPLRVCRQNAFDATNLARGLYNSSQSPRGRDGFAQASHFGTPMIVNENVYVGTTTNVTVFGLLK